MEECSSVDGYDRKLPFSIREGKGKNGLYFSPGHNYPILHTNVYVEKEDK